MLNKPATVVSGAIPITLGTELVFLLPDRALWLPFSRTLAVADIHLGKGNSFRAAGLPIPSGSSAKDLNRLSVLLECLDATRLVILGDMIHARSSHQPELFDIVARWRAKHQSIEILLVRGNHDRSAGRLPMEWNIGEVEEPFEPEAITFSHIPRCGGGKAVICGHIHPIFSLEDFDRSSVRVPCFVLSADNCLILPSFGSLTGGHSVKHQDGQRIFITSGKNVICLNRR